MAKTKSKTGTTVSIKAKCIGCGKTEILSPSQLAAAKLDGAPISTCCYMPMTVEEAIVKSQKTP